MAQSKSNGLAAILQGLLGLAAIAVQAFVKNPDHHDKAVAILNVVQEVAGPIATELAAQPPVDTTPAAQ